MKLRFVTPVPVAWEEVKARFDRDLFLSLNPPWVKANLLRFEGCKLNDEIHLELHQFGLKQLWKSRIIEEKTQNASWWFIDQGILLPWPLVSWSHIHKVEGKDLHQSFIIDDITFTCSSRIMERLIYPVLWMTFAIRPSRYRSYFLRTT